MDDLFKRYGHHIPTKILQETIFHTAVGGPEDRLTLLLQKYAVSLPASFGGELLRYAAMRGRSHCVQSLIHHFGETILPVDRGQALRNAALKGHSEVFRKLLWRYQNSISIQDLGMALENASWGGHSEVVQQLCLRVGAKIPVAYVGDALLDVVAKGQADVVEAFVIGFEEKGGLPHSAFARKYAKLWGKMEIKEILEKGSYQKRIYEALARFENKPLIERIKRALSDLDMAQRKTILKLLSENQQAFKRDFHQQTNQYLRLRRSLMVKKNLPRELAENLIILAGIKIQGIPIPLASKLYALQFLYPEPKERASEKERRLGAWRGKPFEKQHESELQNV